jgi:hypothetical protein
MQEELNSAMAEVPKPQLLDEPSMEQPMEKEWVPPKHELLQQYEINIRFLSRGCVVRAGCKEIAFEDISNAMAQLNEYVAGNTYEIQKKWHKFFNM